MTARTRARRRASTSFRLSHREPRLTLRSRVLFSFSLAAVFLLFTNAFFGFLLVHDTSAMVTRQLVTTAEAAAGTVSPAASAASLADRLSALTAYDVVVVISPHKTGLPRTFRLGPPSGLAAYRALPSDFYGQVLDRGGWRFYEMAGLDPSTTVIVGASLTTLNVTRSNILIEIVILSITSLAIVAVLSLWTLSIAVRPLSEITAIATRIAGGSWGTRVDVDAYLESTEVGDVARAFNAVLEVLTHHIDREHALSSELRQFVADAGHELRTPLTSISGYAQLLARAPRNPEETADALGRITSEAERMRRLIDDLLHLARLENRVGMHYEHFDLSVVVRDVVADHMAIDPGHPVAVEAPRPVMLDADHDQLTAVIANLLANLRSHTPEGTPATLSVAAASHQATLIYRDRGPGMKDPEHLFQRFWRSPGTRAPGSGLGMAIVQGTVDAHRGTIRASSAPGAGLTIVIQIPLSHQADSSPSSESPT